MRLGYHHNAACREHSPRSRPTLRDRLSNYQGTISDQTPDPGNEDLQPTVSYNEVLLRDIFGPPTAPLSIVLAQIPFLLATRARFLSRCSPGTTDYRFSQSR